MTLDAAGNLVLQTAGGDVVEQVPVLYQQVGGSRQAVSGGFVIGADGSVGFEVGAYDATQPLVIDPTLSYSTYLGGTNAITLAQDIAVDSQGSAYVVGLTTSTTFPTTPGVFEPAPAGPTLWPMSSWRSSIPAARPSFMRPISGEPAATSTATATRPNPTWPWTQTEMRYITGQTNAGDFPVTAGALQTVRGDHGGGQPFLTKLNPSGTGLVYSTFFGGTGQSFATGIALDGQGDVYLTGRSTFTNVFPTTPGAFQTTPPPNEQADNAYVAKINSTGSALIYSTLLGGSDSDEAQAIAVDPAGDAYVTGGTASPDFPLKNPIPGVYGRRDWSRVPHGAQPERQRPGLFDLLRFGGRPCASTTSARCIVIGRTSLPDFPITPGAFETMPRSDGGTAFLTKIAPGGTGLDYSTYLGGPEADDGDGHVHQHRCRRLARRVHDR